MHQGDCSFFLHCRSIYYVACRCLCGLLHPKKKNHTREMHLLRRFTVGNGRTFFFLLNMLWSRHVKPSSAKGEKRLKRNKKFQSLYRLSTSGVSIMYKSEDRCTNMKDRITRCRETLRYAKTYQKPSLQSSVHHAQQVELRKEVASGSTIADIEAA